MKSLALRLAGPEDVPALLGMMEPFNALEELPWDSVTKERALGTLLADPSLGVVGVLSVEAEPVGYFVITWGYDLEFDGRDAFLTEFFLMPHARGQGFGSRALEHAEAVAREHGVRALHLLVREENAVARGLYARHGYVSPPRIFLSKQLS